MLFKRESNVHSAAERRRREILEAALRLIAEGGPDAITHRAVADLAKVPLGSLTYYFDSREDLVREAFRLYLAEATAFVAELEQEIRPSSRSAVIELLLEIVRREFTDDPGAVRMEYELILYAARDPLVAREFNAYERGLEARLAALLEALGARRPMDASRTIIDVMRGFEIERLTHPGAELEDLQRRLKLVVDALIRERPATSSKNREPRRVRESKPKRKAVP